MKVQGFRFAGISAGIKKHGGLDLGLIVADAPAVAAGVFTRNLVRAAPVLVSEKRLLEGGSARAIVVNSGNANAYTGEAGMAAALRSTAAIAGALGCTASEVLACSTGVIGQVLPAEKIEAKAAEVVQALDPENFLTFADAILTTDRFRKTAQAEAATAGGKAVFLGACKGAGMIHPDLGGPGKLPQPPGPPHATMLAFIVTDVVADGSDLQQALEEAIEETFNSVSVDGDTSTNDTVLVLASGSSGVRLTHEELKGALVTVCRPLSRAMVQDGEGAEHLVDITVRGLPDLDAARTIARTIATSPLVKTAFAGKDANWGRLIAAAGRAGVPFDPALATIRIGGVTLCEGGVGQPQNDKAACAEMQKPAYSIEIILGHGSGQCTYTTCDLGHSYIDINAGYRS